MLSVRENISPDWDPHNHNHHHYSHNYSRHDQHHVYCQGHLHHLENPQLKRSEDGKETIKAPREAHEGSHMFKIVRRKRPTTEEDGVLLCGDDQVASRVCADCQTSKTPLWRSGPAGPKSLCNACGIRHRKRRRRGLDFETGSSDVLLKEKQIQERVLLLLQRNFAGKEEAEAAVLLMALSCGLFVHS